MSSVLLGTEKHVFCIRRSKDAGKTSGPQKKQRSSDRRISKKPGATFDTFSLGFGRCVEIDTR